MKEAKAVVRSHPQPAPAVFKDTVHAVVADAAAVGGIVQVKPVFPGTAVVIIKPVPHSAQPYGAFAVFESCSIKNIIRRLFHHIKIITGTVILV